MDQKGNFTPPRVLPNSLFGSHKNSRFVKGDKKVRSGGLYLEDFLFKKGKKKKRTIRIWKVCLGSDLCCYVFAKYYYLASFQQYIEHEAISLLILPFFKSLKTAEGFPMHNVKQESLIFRMFKFVCWFLYSSPFVKSIIQIKFQEKSCDTIIGIKLVQMSPFDHQGMSMHPQILSSRLQSKVGIFVLWPVVGKM